MHRKLIFPAIFFIALFAACTEETSNGENKKDSPATKTDTSKSKQGMTVNDPVAPVPKRVSDSIYNGEYVERYDNGVIRKRGDIAGGVAHGEWMSFYPSGKIWSKGAYKDGLRQGYAVSYYENGSKSSEGYYKDGNFVGVWKFWDDYGNMSERDYGDGGK